MSDDEEIKIEDLERLTGQPRRNIRFLIAEQVVPEPRGKSRWASYGPEHVKALALYSEMKASGISSLEVIKERIRLAEDGGPMEIVPLPGVEVTIEGAVLKEMGTEALVKQIGAAVRKAIAHRGERK